jgi:hypothetical protein
MGLPPLIPYYGMKFHQQNKLPQAIWRHNKKPRAAAFAMGE